ncbi:hypothetical protein A3H80_02605 [Candidatus Roizmanbacteria bacterium RIFCSPLOWO2_02_FULL_37_19]|uniref:EamA domain-containing protein n=1 Tax=Candidatus Roizmanbacteria bacterium RIFCSPHIGHO2_02_FULL_37_24 TaxID=1802037 RepID=A0A1F7H1J7_9BACT|nr:MAG: hypothetical protein A2862_02310 [Candidatus Roizmanbacteria bacterium RIFCSPHIGHO2_01_FULL_38_41]OGK24814.1 MAG: hypothetical protein A3C24_00760 [Candidatus Roizmanbacteria bacterium RIFCSPHIGHO2_02_FULL_37_24]OGK32788.1 MAG: hypothetical protein A3E10_03275 [Candidatus Roizmanbacteria bacterium RIFCSPHIGHO2_12_FULL_37_23]OGK45586.1 MAG: hypothetical protein A2956_02755 [Candidatus Roizmanbacteria bacterium RIFCSPLOWO2_01_FULL_37_57]OGK53630.1 MAG: hypothetical protein A3H80_02605 [Ca
MKKILSIGPLFIMIAALLWSLDGIIRTSLFSLPPTVIVFWEHLLGALVLIPFIFIKRKEISQLTRKEWIALGIISLFSGVLGTVMYTAALGKVQYIQFSVVVLLQQLQPIWAISAAAIILKEKLTKKFIYWAALGILSTYLISFKDLTINLASGNQTLIAALLALGAGFVWAVSTSFSKIVLHKVSYQLTTLLRFLITPLFAILFVFGFGNQASLLALDQSQWIRLIIIVFSTGMVALLIYYYGLRKTPARVSSIAELTWPASAIFIDYFYFHNSLSPTQIVGVAILAVSIYKVSQFKK